jgi:hypothetical protein
MPSRLTVYLLIATVVFLLPGSFVHYAWTTKHMYAWHHPNHIPKPDPRPTVGPEPPVNTWIAENQKPWMQIIVSLALMAASLFVILNTGYGPKDKHWAYGIIGTLVGHWLRS